jgi:hypothetical protein
MRKPPYLDEPNNTNNNNNSISSSKQPSLPMSVNTDCQLPSLVGARPRSVVTPNPSFGDRDQSWPQEQLLHSMEWSLPTPTSNRQSPSSPGRRQRASVGLPSQYPSYDRNSSLIGALSEELQDFYDLFGSSSSSIQHRFDEKSMDMVAFPYTDEENNEKVASITPSSSSISASSSEERNQMMDVVQSTPTTTSPPPKRKHRRSNNRALGTSDFFDLILKDL